MNRETKQLLSTLLDTNFLNRVGHPLDGFNARQCSTWKEACVARKRNSTVELISGALDWLHNDVFEAGFNKPGAWNQMVSGIKEESADLNREISRVVSDLSLTEKDRNLVDIACQQDLMCVLIETELSSLTKIHTFRTIGEVYLKGHFLCGWDGEFPYERDRALPWGGDFPPDGQLVIY
jgi:hypothetical protein